MSVSYADLRRKVNVMADPVVKNLPDEWSSEKQTIAKEAMVKLVRAYPGWQWQIEFNDEPTSDKIAAMIIRLGDLMTDVVYLIGYKDIDMPEMHCALVAGGMMLEAHGLSRTKGRHDEVHGLKQTPSGFIVPDYAALPENNPGYIKTKQKFEEYERSRQLRIEQDYLMKFDAHNTQKTLAERFADIPMAIA
jgi:hypothetical protein